MRKTASLLSLLLAALSLTLWAQTKGRPAATQRPQANLNQLMRGVLYPASNVVFSAQSDNPADAKPPAGTDPSMATDPLLSTFGGWTAVENAALALTESANLLMIPGRTCSNGAPVPLANPEWAKYVQALRDAGMVAYKAAQAKDQEKILDAADALTTACANCHMKWREGRPAANRCK